MKPLDWILLVISLTGLYTFSIGLLFTPKIVFELMPRAEAILRRRFYWFIFPAVLIIWRVWG